SVNRSMTAFLNCHVALARGCPRLQLAGARRVRSDDVIIRNVCFPTHHPPRSHGERSQSVRPIMFSQIKSLLVKLTHSTPVNPGQRPGLSAEASAEAGAKEYSTPSGFSAQVSIRRRHPQIIVFREIRITT